MKKAFTFIEIMAVMIVIGLLFVITTFCVSKIMADSGMSRFKKGYANIENVVSYLISNKSIYGSRLGFKDTSKAELMLSKTDENGNTVSVKTGEVIGDVPVNKFRDGFKYSLDVVKDNLKCEIYPSGESDNCFMTDDGVVYGIPNTDFENTNVISINDSDGDRVNIVPITMYVDYNGELKDPSRDAFIIGVQYDGTLHFVRTFKDCESDPKVMQCRLEKYVKSNSISMTSEDFNDK